MTICTDKCTSCVNGELIQKSRADIKIRCEAKDKLLPYGCKVECEFFEKKKFADIHNSVHSKIFGLAFVTEELKDGTLKTEKPYIDFNWF